MTVTLPPSRKKLLLCAHSNQPNYIPGRHGRCLGFHTQCACFESLNKLSCLKPEHLMVKSWCLHSSTRETHACNHTLTAKLQVRAAIQWCIFWDKKKYWLFWETCGCMCYSSRMPPFAHMKAKKQLLMKYFCPPRWYCSLFVPPFPDSPPSLPALYLLSSGLTCFVWISAAVLQLSWEGFGAVDRSRFFRSIEMTVWVRAVEAR